MLPRFRPCLAVVEVIRDGKEHGPKHVKSVKEVKQTLVQYQLRLSHFEPGFAEDRGRFAKLRSPAVERFIDV